MSRDCEPTTAPRTRISLFEDAKEDATVQIAGVSPALSLRPRGRLQHLQRSASPRLPLDHAPVQSRSDDELERRNGGLTCGRGAVQPRLTPCSRDKAHGRDPGSVGELRTSDGNRSHGQLTRSLPSTCCNTEHPARQLRPESFGTESNPDSAHRRNDPILSVPVAFARRHGETRIVIQGRGGDPNPTQDPALIKAIARGHSWFEEIATGQATALPRSPAASTLPNAMSAAS
jgi:hypothetical protein